jgi:uncharacterized protein
MRTAVFVAVALAASGCFKLDSFLYTPGRTNQYVLDPNGDSAADTVTPDRIEALTIQESSQISLGAVYVKGNVQPPAAYAIYFHGKGGTLDDNFWRMKRLSNLGYDTLGFDYRGWGMSTNVTPTEAGIDQDSQAVLAFLSSRLGSSKYIFYYGQSFGTATATQLAASNSPFVLILESAFASIEAFKDNSSLMDFPSGYIASDGWDTVDRVKSIYAPLLLLHGEADTYVSPVFSQQIYANANAPKQLVLVPGADHDDVPQTMGASYATTVNAWVNQYLPQ